MKLYKMMWGWSNNYAVKPQCIQGASGVCVCMCALLSYLGRLSFYLGLPANFPLGRAGAGGESLATRSRRGAVFTRALGRRARHIDNKGQPVARPLHALIYPSPCLLETAVANFRGILACDRVSPSPDRSQTRPPQFSWQRCRGCGLRCSAWPLPARATWQCAS